jgi:hypothetical protein
MKDCPKCQLANPGSALRCDCGYDFASDTIKPSYLLEGKQPITGKKGPSRWIRSVLLGAASEVIVLLSAGIPHPSTEPPTTWQIVVVYTQWPGSSVVGFLGHFDVVSHLREPFSAIWAVAIIAIGLFIQAVVFAAPFWAVSRYIRWRQSNGKK